jgi:hypothetical protein
VRKLALVRTGRVQKAHSFRNVVLSFGRLTRFYEKVIKVKADVAAIHLKFALAPIAPLDKRSSTKLKLMGDAQGGKALLRGEPLLLRRGGNHPAPAFPWGNGKGDSIPCCRRLLFYLADFASGSF